MDIQTHLLEELKASNDLLKFYEDLKQKRFAHLLTIQTAFLAFFALLAKDALANLSMVSLTALVFIAVPPFIPRYFARVDLRSRVFVEATKTRLLLLEDEWKAVAPDNYFSTHQQLFDVLNRRDKDRIANYSSARNLEKDAFNVLATVPAHASEHAILRMFWWLWIVLASLAAIIHVGWHVSAWDSSGL